MSARVSVDQPGPGQLRIRLRQREGEVVQFGVFVTVVMGALYALMPRARTEPGWLIALLAVAAAWSAVALSAQEVYAIDESDDTLVVTRSSLLGRRVQTIDTRELASVRLELGGPDDNRRLVELVGRDGTVRLRIPARLTTLTAQDQSAVGQLIADQLGVPLRGAVSS